MFSGKWRVGIRVAACATVLLVARIASAQFFQDIPEALQKSLTPASTQVIEKLGEMNSLPAASGAFTPGTLPTARAWASMTPPGR